MNDRANTLATRSRVLAASVFAFGLLGTTAVATAAAATVGTITVSPTTPVAGGQTIVINGSGWAPNASMAWCQGVPAPAGAASQAYCDGGAYSTGTADATGHFSGSQLIARFVDIPALGQRVDCGDPAQTCTVGAADRADVAGTAVGLPLTFAPIRPIVVPHSGSVVEGNASSSFVTVPVTLSEPPIQPVTVDWTTVFVPGWPGTQADPANDYTPAAGTVSFAPGEVAKSVRVAVTGDTVVEPNEHVFVSFRHAVNARLDGVYGLGVAVITNDDLPVVVTHSARALEGDTGNTVVDLSVTLSQAPILPVTMDWSTVYVPAWSGAQADPANDYTPATGTVTFAPGETTKTITVAVAGDTLVEPDEHVFVSFRHPVNARLDGVYGLGVVVIANDDGA